MNVVIAAGGTGGHIFPALSLADTLVRDHGAEVRFIGSRDGQEATRIPAAGYRFDAVEAAPFVREVSMRAAKAPVIAARRCSRAPRWCGGRTSRSAWAAT